MKKHSLYLLVLSLCVMTIVSCEKESTGDDNCRKCRVLNNNGSVQLEKELCSEADITAFQTQYAGREITCD